MAPININKQGILQANPIEPYIKLSDGSDWQLILFHYVDHGNNLFTQENAGYCNDYGLFSRLQYVDAFIWQDEQYHFYLIQDDKKFRWTQPLSMGKPSTIAGYSSPNYDSTHLNPCYGIATKTTNPDGVYGYSHGGAANQYGTCGGWTKVTASGKSGVPGFGGVDASAICEYYQALYVRVNKPIAFIERDAVNANSFIEY